MSEEKQIEKMTELMCGNYADGICSVDACVCNHNCEYKLIANHLYNRGYHKRGEAKWIVTGGDRDRRAVCSNCGKEYCVQKGMLQLQTFPYCPTCGANIKGVDCEPLMEGGEG